MQALIRAAVRPHWRTHVAAATAGAVAALLYVPGHLSREIVGGQLPTIIAMRAGQSNNWAGYAIGALDRGGATFHGVSAEWTVPAAASQGRGPNASAVWVGIGGGCVDRSCTSTDGTLLQVGTEQDVDSSGRATYSAWYEPVPGPSVAIGAVQVHPGDRVRADVHEVAPGTESWSIGLADLTTGRSFSRVTAYPSSYLTAEWVVETPLLEETGGALSVGTLPALPPVAFTHTTLNGAPAGLGDAPMRLLDLEGHTLAAPSSAGPTGDSFAVCEPAVPRCAPPG